MKLKAILIEVIGTAVEDFFGKFPFTDFGKAAIDAVQWAETEIDGSGDDKREAAKVKLLEQLELAGHDVTQLVESEKNFLIETAKQLIPEASASEQGAS